MHMYAPPSKPSRPNGTSLRPLSITRLAGVAVADSRLDPSGHPALRRHHVQGREPGVVDGAGGFDQLFGPGDRLVIFDP